MNPKTLKMHMNVDGNGLSSVDNGNSSVIICSSLDITAYAIRHCVRNMNKALRSSTLIICNVVSRSCDLTYRSGAARLGAMPNGWQDKRGLDNAQRS